MVDAMIERTERIAAPSETAVFDFYCPICRSGYLGSMRFRADHRPPRGTVHHRGQCNVCRKWRWVDSADGVPRAQWRDERAST